MRFFGNDACYGVSQFPTSLAVAYYRQLRDTSHDLLFDLADVLLSTNDRRACGKLLQVAYFPIAQSTFSASVASVFCHGGVNKAESKTAHIKLRAVEN